jgi:hydroxyacylglutathione hydrolase
MIERLIVGPMETNCYIYSNGKKECIIIDPGGDAERIVASINMLKLVPAGIVLTHGHFDHTAAVASLKQLYAREGIQVPVAIHRADKHYLGKRAEATNQETLRLLGLEDPEPFRELFAGLPDADDMLEEGQQVYFTALSVLETPGHTRGSICLYGEKEGLVFTGDSLFFMGIGRTDLPGGDEKALLQVIREKLLTLPPHTRVFPGHGLDTTIERELKANPFLR